MMSLANLFKIVSELFINKQKIQQNEYNFKRKHLKEIYEELLKAIKLFPDYSPADILIDIELTMHYSNENFDSLIEALRCQIVEYKKRLEYCSFDQKYDIDVQIQNMGYAQRKITEIRDKYYAAKNLYNSVYNSDITKIDLYAGQDVKNRLVEFDVIIKNVFLSGYLAQRSDSTNNIIKVSRRNLINSLRNDIGIS